MSVAFVFPGPGAQRRGMGRDLFAKYPNYVQQADDVLGYSLRSLCREGPDAQLNSTQFTQPALYVFNTLHLLEEQRTHAARGRVRRQPLDERPCPAVPCGSAFTGLSA